MTASAWQSEVQKNAAVPVYKEFWPDCDVHENDSLSDDEVTARLLDFGDVDKIILQNNGAHIHMAQRFRKPWTPKGETRSRDPDFTLRYSRPTTDNTIEYERLMSAHQSESAAYPKRYAFGRVYEDHTRGLYELYIFDTDRLIQSIKCGAVREIGPIQTDEMQEMMAYPVNELVQNGVVVNKWTDSGVEPGANTGQSGPGCNKYYVRCPGCGAKSGPYTEMMAQGSRFCSCGVWFKIDTENQRASEVGER